MIGAANCPHCGKNDAEAIKFTWWGGLVGPKMFHHSRCMQCGKTYNAKTGKPNTTAILLYVVISTVVIFGLLFFLFKNGF